MADGHLDVVDYSWARPDHAQLKAAGVVGCMRYLYRNGKGLTADEVALFRRSGLALGLNYEAGAGDFVGREAGAAQAAAARQLARELGVAGVIVFSADFDAQRSQFAAVGDAVEGALSVLGDGNVGVYGKADLIDYLFARFGARIFYWQTYAWSGGRRSTHADLYQFRNGQDLAGGEVDFNEITGRTFWALGATPNHGTSGGSAVPIEEDSMSGFATDKDDQAAMASIVHDKMVEVLRAPEFDLDRLSRRADDLEQANKAVAPMLGLARQLIAGQRVSAADVAAALLPGVVAAVTEAGGAQATAQQIVDLLAQKLAS